MSASPDPKKSPAPAVDKALRALEYLSHARHGAGVKTTGPSLVSYQVTGIS